MTTWDAVIYTIAQFLDELLGIAVMVTLLSRGIAHPAVNFVMTGSREFVISFLRM